MNRNQQINKYLKLLGISLLALILFVGCAKSIDVTACVGTKTYGFWNGLWHGIISPVTFFVSLFKERVAIYAVNNNGGWYDFGFMIGISIIMGVPCKAACRKRKCKNNE